MHGKLDLFSSKNLAIVATILIIGLGGAAMPNGMIVLGNLQLPAMLPRRSSNSAEPHIRVLPGRQLHSQRGVGNDIRWKRKPEAAASGFFLSIFLAPSYLRLPTTSRLWSHTFGRGPPAPAPLRTQESSTLAPGTVGGGDGSCGGITFAYVENHVLPRTPRRHERGTAMAQAPRTRGGQDLRTGSSDLVTGQLNLMLPGYSKDASTSSKILESPGESGR